MAKRHTQKTETKTNLKNENSKTETKTKRKYIQKRRKNETKTKIRDSSSIRARYALDSSSIRFENPVTIAIRFDMRSIRARFEHSRKEWTCSIFSIIESSSNRARIESNPLSQLRFELDSSSIRFENPVTIAIRFDMRSIRARFEHSRISHSRIESQLWQGSRIESSSNRAHIELESSSNRNCDRRFFSQSSATDVRSRVHDCVSRWRTCQHLLIGHIPEKSAKVRSILKLHGIKWQQFDYRLQKYDSTET